VLLGLQLEAADLIPQASRLLVSFFRHGDVEQLPEPFNLTPHVAAIVSSAFGVFARVIRALVNPLEERFEFPFKLGVTIAAPKLPQPADIGEAHPATAAPDSEGTVSLRNHHRLRLKEACEDIMEGKAGLEVHFHLSPLPSADRKSVA